ncbi:MAG: hypothetical protein QNJ34_18690 [Xenococcaceae cyanobacterium MO_188.B29]|nr:hypothetical protein [Xenococcaceae cyanobacterium MO_188.B29]
MNALFFNLFKKTYRKESVSSFILILGAVDAVIGGVGERWTLMSFGLLMVMASALLRWYKLQKAEAVVSTKSPRYFLPPSPSSPPLPLLKKKKPHQ